ncbi:RNA polymerase sigma factor [Roseivivax sediminis]|uniref:RNA polymerase, sigma subunit, ECF family n=1 Tax=Roseivivax sediminis TaxID=936889 RepID=A0A1I1TBS5_9RHOB|nr:RNA polymerase sigma factor [Roseivivax sediminis]SFD56036.1 RNA polymerase, sigma subunit, ECF family [Roseivivax sediminis]
MNDTGDEELLARYAAGDRAAAQALTLRLVPGVFAHATRLLGDRAEAEDIAQEVMLKLWRIAPDWRAGEAKVTTWLYRVTANLCIDRMRRRRGHPLDEVPEPVDDAPSADARLAEADRASALAAALSELPARQRQAVVLRHIEGLGNPEIARIMDIGPRAVESLTARGKRALETILSGRREELGYADTDT